MSSTVQISFPAHTAAVGDQNAGSLLRALQRAHPEVKLERLKADPDTQNGGDIIQIIMASAALAHVASGVASWLARNSGATIRIDLPDGTHVNIKHSGENTAETVKAVFGNLRGSH